MSFQRPVSLKKVPELKKLMDKSLAAGKKPPFIRAPRRVGLGNILKK